MPDPNHTSRQRAQLLVIALFAVYLVLLAWIVLWKLEVPWIGDAAGHWRPIKWVPFVPSGDADASAPLEVAVNFALFIPFGLYLGQLAPSWQWWKAIGVFAGASVGLETAQHLLSIGSVDITDVIANTAGGLAGLGLLALARRSLRTRTAPVMVRVFAVGTVVCVLAVAAFIASPLHYGPQRDVIVQRPSASA